MAGLQNLIGGNDGNGQIGQAAVSIRKLADDLDKNTNQIATGLNQFSNTGLKEFEALAVDGRHTLAELNKAIKNINEHPSQLLFGH
jgi:phospholipid/cholesterol/gamma-HCH transport system substrate-binding protein